MTKMIDMTINDNPEAFIDSYDPSHIGFFLNADHTKKLGLDNSKAGDEIAVKGVLKIKTVTSGEGSTELYVCIKELGVDGKDKSSTDKMSETYEE